MAGYADDLEGVLSDALALLSEIIDGDQMYDPGTEEEQESRDYLLARHYEVRAEAARIGAIPADPHPSDPCYRCTKEGPAVPGYDICQECLDATRGED